MGGPVASATDIVAPQHHQIHDQLTSTHAHLLHASSNLPGMELVRNCGIPPKTPIPFLVETPSHAFSTHSLLKVPNSKIIPTLTFQFQSPALKCKSIGEKKRIQWPTVHTDSAAETTNSRSSRTGDKKKDDTKVHGLLQQRTI